MALNPKTIKALFGKLSPYVDVTPKYSAPKFEHGLEAITKDMQRIIKGVDANALPVQNAGSVLKKVLDINPTLKPNSLIDIDPVIKRNNDNFFKFYYNAIPPAQLSDVPSVTNVLGDDVLLRGMLGSRIRPELGSVSVPELPVSELVVNGTQVVPHANTALGKWYRRVKGNPKFTAMYRDPIGPVGETDDWDLPF